MEEQKTKNGEDSGEGRGKSGVRNRETQDKRKEKKDLTFPDERCTYHKAMVLWIFWF